MGWAPLVGRPAHYLPSGTVGQWLPAPCNGGTCARAATLEPTKRRRGLTQNSRAGNPKRPRPNCHKKENSRNSVGSISAQKREGAQEPRCARSERRRGAVGFYLVVAATTGTWGAWHYGRMSETPLRRTDPIQCGQSRPATQTARCDYALDGQKRDFSRVLLQNCAGTDCITLQPSSRTHVSSQRDQRRATLR